MTEMEIDTRDYRGTKRKAVDSGSAGQYLKRIKVEDQDHSHKPRLMVLARHLTKTW